MRHSTKSYSTDLRKRVVSARLSGRSVSEVSALYEVDDNSVYRWVSYYKETGSYTPKQRCRGRKPKIVDMEKFARFAEAHAYCTLAQMCAKWEDDVSKMCMSRTLKRLGWTRKKNKRTIVNVMKRNENLS